MHAPVAGSGICFAGDLPASRLGEFELVICRGFFRHHEQGKSSSALGHVRISPGQKRDHIGSAGESAPGLGTIDDPAVFAVHRCALGSTLSAGDITSDVRFGDRNGHHDLARGEFGQPFFSLVLGSPAQKSLGEDFRSGNERSCGRQ